MAFVPPDNLRRLIIQYYRQSGRPIPKDVKFSPKSFLFVKYHCDFGYELVDEVDTMFCHDKTWVNTPPVCRGKGVRVEGRGAQESAKRTTAAAATPVSLWETSRTWSVAVPGA